jgi:CDGSH-type Zn-finger protein
MSSDEMLEFPRQIQVEDDGPYLVTGSIPLVRKIQVVSEMGEPLTWKKQGDIAADAEYTLCRCGHSEDMPFCDGSHHQFDWDCSEKAPTNLSVIKREELSTGSLMTIHFDPGLCTESGFCGNRFISLLNGGIDTDDIQVRTLAIHMIEHCPSGALTYQLPGARGDVEADLPEQIAMTTEITSEGPILGPLWVTGNIPIMRADGKPFETRKRVTLCNCGHSNIKPLCDGSHRDLDKQRKVAIEK